MRIPARRSSEVIQTDYGTTLYTVDRSKMRDEFAILRRMADDIADLVKEAGEGGTFTRADLILLGWKGLQVTLHSKSALELSQRDAAFTIHGEVAA